MTRLKVFISSRVDALVPNGSGAARGRGAVRADRGSPGAPIPLRGVRAEIERRLTAAFTPKGIEVWRNDNEPAGTDQPTLELCERWARESHLVIAIVNGQAGSPAPNGLGICHAELVAAMRDTPSKLILLRIKNVADANFARPENHKFRGDFDPLWRGWSKFGASPSTAAEIVDASMAAVLAAVARMADISLSEWRRGRATAGQALDWARQTYSQRAQTLRQQMLTEAKDLAVFGTDLLEVGTSGVLATAAWTVTDPLALTFSAVPDSFGVPDARQHAGYPFRRDAEVLREVRTAAANAEGPLHVIGIYKNVTESQIRSHIGNPDIALLRLEFGFLAQDNAQAIQVAYLPGLQDATAVRKRLFALRSALVNPEVSGPVLELARRRAAMLQ